MYSDRWEKHLRTNAKMKLDFPINSTVVDEHTGNMYTVVGYTFSHLEISNHGQTKTVAYMVPRESFRVVK